MSRMRAWYDRYSNMKLAKKMIIIYVIILGVCSVFSVTALQYSFNIYDNKLYEKSLQELDFFTQQVNRSLDEVEDLSYSIAIDTKIQEQLAKMKRKSSALFMNIVVTSKIRRSTNNFSVSSRIKCAEQVPVLLL